MAALSGVEPLAEGHDTSDFDCGKPEMTDWLKQHALANQLARGTRTFVVHRANRVVGYHSLVASSVEHRKAPEQVRQGLGRYPIPVFLLARLAVDTREQGKGLGSGLLRDALFRAERAADQVAARAILVHALDEEAKGFYEHFGFEPSPTDPLHLYLLMKDVSAWLEEIRGESS